MIITARDNRRWRVRAISPRTRQVEWLPKGYFIDYMLFGGARVHWRRIPSRLPWAFILAHRVAPEFLDIAVYRSDNLDTQMHQLFPTPWQKGRR